MLNPCTVKHRVESPEFSMRDPWSQTEANMSLKSPLVSCEATSSHVQPLAPPLEGGGR